MDTFTDADATFLERYALSIVVLFVVACAAVLIQQAPGTLFGSVVAALK